MLPPGSAGFCVGGPDAGSRCSTVTAPCRAATGCSTCIPVQEVAVGDTFSCELLVTNVDTATTPLPAPHAQAIGQLTDEIHRTPSTCPSSSMATATGCLFDVFSSGMVFGQCIGGSEPQKRCQSGMECPGGICSLTRHCVDPATNADGGACPPLVQLGKPCMIGGSAICSAILGHADPLPDSFFVALHTDVAQRTDPNPLLDTARTKGEDLGQFAPSDFTLDFPGFINVLFPPQLVGCRITGGSDDDGHDEIGKLRRAGRCSVRMRRVLPRLHAHSGQLDAHAQEQARELQGHGLQQPRVRLHRSERTAGRDVPACGASPDASRYDLRHRQRGVQRLGSNEQGSHGGLPAGRDGYG